MNWYRLLFGGTQLGDEVIQPAGTWRRSAGATGREGTLEPIARMDDRPLGMMVFPTFRVLKRTGNQWEFERWVFDLLTWADGRRRTLTVVLPTWYPVVDYGSCKLISLDRPERAGPDEGRWSDQVILTFQSDTDPQFYDWSA